MTQTYTLTEAKAKLSELISRVHFGNEKFTITRKGKAVAIVTPINENLDGGNEEGLLRARGALSDHDDVIDELVETVYLNREKVSDRAVEI